MEKYELYWIKENTMSDPFSEGYIGITKRGAEIRVNEHIKQKELNDVSYQVLHCGAKKYISELERKYRPESNIGWNKSPGGLAGGRPYGIYTKGWKHSEEANKKKSERFKGENNPMYGKNITEDHKKAISKANSIAKPHISELMKTLHKEGKARQWTTENNPKSRKISVEGKVYPSIAECKRQLKIRNKGYKFKYGRDQEF